LAANLAAGSGRLSPPLLRNIGLRRIAARLVSGTDEAEAMDDEFKEHFREPHYRAGSQARTDDLKLTRRALRPVNVSTTAT
jgi:hypothetical protein